MLSDIEIAQQAKMLPITEVAPDLPLSSASAKKTLKCMAVTRLNYLWI